MRPPEWASGRGGPRLVLLFRRLHARAEALAYRFDIAVDSTVVGWATHQLLLRVRGGTLLRRSPVFV